MAGISKGTAEAVPFRGSGLWIALYGPDGAGKSAVATQLRSTLAPYFRAIAMHHLRIPLGATNPQPQPEPVAQPHAQAPRGALLSYLKVIYMFAHGWLAHLMVTLPAREAGELVICDRYFLDYTVDLQRYRLAETSLGFTSMLGRFAPRPDLQFVLDVPAEKLQQRKAEVSFAESARQRVEYGARIATLPNALVINADKPVAEVVDEIAVEVLKFMRCNNQGTVEVDLVGA